MEKSRKAESTWKNWTAKEVELLKEVEKKFSPLKGEVTHHERMTAIAQFMGTGRSAKAVDSRLRFFKEQNCKNCGLPLTDPVRAHLLYCDNNCKQGKPKAGKATMGCALPKDLSPYSTVEFKLEETTEEKHLGCGGKLEEVSSKLDELRSLVEQLLEVWR